MSERKFPHYWQPGMPLLIDCAGCGERFDSMGSLNADICDDCTDRLDWPDLENRDYSQLHNARTCHDPC